MKELGGHNTERPDPWTDKLAQVNTTSTIRYAYDPLGRRISRSDGAGTTNYHLSSKSDFTNYDIDQNGKLTGAYLRGADGLISQTDYTGQSPVTSYDLFNPHGDTSAATDANGNVIGTYRYDSFGNVISGNPPEDGYTGKWQREADPAAGTIRMGAREYDPSLGRFISADPLKGDPTVPQQLSRYPYVGNDPLARYDLSGLYPLENYVDAGEALFEWATGTGPEIQNYGPDSPQVQDMKSSLGIQDAIDRFYEINEGRRCDQYLPLPTLGEGFGAPRPFFCTSYARAKA